MEEREKKVVTGVAALGGLGLAAYLLVRRAKAKPPKWVEVTGFKIIGGKSPPSDGMRTEKYL